MKGVRQAAPAPAWCARVPEQPSVPLRRQAGAAGAGGASAEPNASDRWSSALPNAEPPHNIRHVLARCADVTTWVSNVAITHPRCTKVLDARIAASSKAAWGKSSLRWLAAAIKGRVPDQKPFPSRHGAPTNWWVTARHVQEALGRTMYPGQMHMCSRTMCVGLRRALRRKMSGSGTSRLPMCCGRCLQLRLKRCACNPQDIRKESASNHLIWEVHSGTASCCIRPAACNSVGGYKRQLFFMLEATRFILCRRHLLSPAVQCHFMATVSQLSARLSDQPSQSLVG